ncbi:MAG: sporulation domain-containing protein, partial [Actinomycetes bacterium]
MINPSPHRRTVIIALAVSLPFAFLAPAGASTAAPKAPEPRQQTSAPSPSGHLDLGAQGLPETRTVTTLAPGLTRTTITRGTPNQDFFWTAEVGIPSMSTGPDAPASALSTRAQAQVVT